MRIVQVATTLGQSCGVGNFASNLGTALADAGIDVRTVASVLASGGEADADATILHHEWGLFGGDDAVRDLASRCPQPVVMFAHSGGGVERFSDAVAGFIAMSPRVVGPTMRPVCVVPHPAWVPKRLKGRARLRERYGLPHGVTIVGSNGFLVRQRGFADIVELLLPRTADRAVFVDLVSSPWYKAKPEIVTRLEEIAAAYPGRLRFGTSFLSSRDLNARLQACDLLWCWTNVPSIPYGSGSISDQYASGTRIVAADKEQHAHVLALPNVVTAPPRLDEFVDTLVAEIASGDSQRHDPAPVSFEACARDVTSLVRGVVDGMLPATLQPVP